MARNEHTWADKHYCHCNKSHFIFFLVIFDANLFGVSLT